MTIQYIKDEEGKDQYVVIPYSDYFRMRLALLEYDDEDESDWEDIPYESDIYDDVMLPGDRGLQKMCNQAFNPPSTSSPVPEICPAAGLARKVTAAAMSSGWP